jgi:hypothetical protein
MVTRRNTNIEHRPSNTEHRSFSERRVLRSTFSVRCSMLDVLATGKPPLQRGGMMVELLVAIALLVGVMLPIAFSIASEQRLARAYYQRAVAMEIVDGEMEALAAGEWRAFTPGVHRYPVRAAAATNLPPGEFRLMVATNKVRLEWQPAVKQRGGPVVREVVVK